MHWINLKASDLDRAEFRSADPVERATWLCLMRYCCGQEAGDRIPGCKEWSDRAWQQTCAVTSSEVLRKCGLWRWEDKDLVVHFYPHAAEEAMRQKRQAAHDTNRKRHAKRDAERDGQRDANERKGNETKEKENGVALAPDSIPSEQEVRDWAREARVDPEFAVQKWNETSERHGWIYNDRLIQWKRRFKRFWDKDKNTWAEQKNPRGGGPDSDGTPPAPGTDGVDFSEMRV